MVLDTGDYKMVILVRTDINMVLSQIPIFSYVHFISSYKRAKVKLPHNVAMQFWPLTRRPYNGVQKSSNPGRILDSQR